MRENKGEGNTCTHTFTAKEQGRERVGGGRGWVEAELLMWPHGQARGGGGRRRKLVIGRRWGEDGVGGMPCWPLDGARRLVVVGGGDGGELAGRRRGGMVSARVSTKARERGERLGCTAGGAEGAEGVGLCYK